MNMKVGLEFDGGQVARSRRTVADDRSSFPCSFAHPGAACIETVERVRGD